MTHREEKKRKTYTHTRKTPTVTKQARKQKKPIKPPTKFMFIMVSQLSPETNVVQFKGN